MATQAYWAPSDGALPYVRGTAADAQGETVEFVPADGGAPRTLPRSELHPAVEVPPGGAPDNAQLPHLHEPSLLHNLVERYGADAIYTYVGPVLLAVNPYKRLPGLYDPERIEEYRGRALGVLPPHVYAMADRARRLLVSERRDQSLVVSGESGAGKTESCKAILGFLAHHSRHSREESGGLCDAMIATSPLLESFGCAVTVRNKNSSRFGKLMQMWTAADAASFSSSSIITYLLEKGRVSHHAPGERNFHAFYQLVAAAAERSDGGAGWDELPGLCAAAGRGASAFHYLSQGGDAAPTISSDLADFGSVVAALRTLGAGEAELQSAWAMLSAILALGELRYEAEEGTDAKALLTPSTVEHMESAAKALGVDTDMLKARLTARTVHTGRGSSYKIRYGIDGATSCRDGLAREIYQRLFGWVVATINRSLGRKSAAAPGSPAAAAARGNCIAILDIFGFEKLDANSLEQLLINHTNERLQLYFIERTVQAELAHAPRHMSPACHPRASPRGTCVPLTPPPRGRRSSRCTRPRASPRPTCAPKTTRRASGWSRGGRTG